MKTKATKVLELELELPNVKSGGSNGFGDWALNQDYRREVYTLRVDQVTALAVADELEAAVRAIREAMKDGAKS